MNTVKIALIFFLLTSTALAGNPTPRYSSKTEKTYFKDNHGRPTGSVIKNGNTYTFKDNRGYTTSKAKIQASGKTYFYDKQGFPTGSATGPYSPTMKGKNGK